MGLQYEIIISNMKFTMRDYHVDNVVEECPVSTVAPCSASREDVCALGVYLTLLSPHGDFWVDAEFPIECSFENFTLIWIPQSCMRDVPDRGFRTGVS